MSDPIDRLNAALSGRYNIERKLGEGGMASVYLAEDLRHERKVALKVLKPELAAVVGAERFLTEIKTTANLQHPHVLPLFDSGEADGFLFYVMPYIEGETLRERLSRERQLPVAESIRIATAIANALQTAHDAGIVHRDIKPANILLSRGEPLVADFGIALAVGSAGGSRLTETGLSLGTPYYMSPEQATGDQHIGPPSDIYALGAMLYEMLTGDPPYIGSTAQAVLGKIIQGEPVSATAVRKSIPLHVDAAIRKALEKLPADRFTRAEDFARALADPTFQHGATAASVGAGAGRWKGVALASSAVALVLAAVLGWQALAPEVPAPVTRLPVEVPEAQAFNGGRGELDLSEDGSVMVYRGESPDGRPQLWARYRDQVDATPVRDSEGAHGPAISPDGSEVAFGVGLTIRVAPLQGGVARTVAEDANCCPAWSRDGEWIYYLDQESFGVSRVPAAGGPREVITVPDTVTGGAFHVLVQSLPGDGALLFQVDGGNLDASEVRAHDLETGETVTLTTGKTPKYSPTGHQLFIEENHGTLMAAPFDVDALELTGPAAPVLEGVLEHEQGWPFFDVSNTGRLVYRTGTSAGGVVTPSWVDEDGTSRPVDPSWSFVGDEDLSSVAVSPSGDRIVASITDAEGTTDLWVKPLDGGPLFRLTFEGTVNIRPRWSSDGQFVTFVSDRAGQRDLWRKRADGSGTAELILDRERPIQQLDWSPDEEWLAFAEYEGDNLPAGQGDITATRPGTDGDPILLVDPPGDGVVTEMELSPDGRWLAYVRAVDGDIQVYVRPFPDVNAGRWQISTERGDEPVWSVDGSRLYFQEGEPPGQQMVAEIVTEPAFAIGQVRSLFPLDAHLGGNGQSQYDAAPDGRLLMLETVSSDSRLIFVENWTETLRR